MNAAELLRLANVLEGVHEGMDDLAGPEECDDVWAIIEYLREQASVC